MPGVMDVEPEPEEAEELEQNESHMSHTRTSHRTRKPSNKPQNVHVLARELVGSLAKWYLKRRSIRHVMVITRKLSTRSALLSRETSVFFMGGSQKILLCAWGNEG